MKWIVSGSNSINVAVGGNIGYSYNNGKEWNISTTGTAIFSGFTPYDVAYSATADKWVIVGSAGRIAYSSEGINWSQSSNGTQIF